MMRLVLCLVLAWSVAAPISAATGKRNIAETDIYAFRWVADPQISPDGSQVAYTLVAVNATKDGYDTSVWLVPSKGMSAGAVPRQITAGPRDSSPRWSPDGKRIAFSRAPEKGSPQVYVLPMEGGEAQQLTDLPKGANNVAWAPDGRTIAFTSTTNDDDLAAKKTGEEVSDVRVITRAVYRSNGSGYTDYARPAHIWTAPVPAVVEKPQKATQLTSGRFPDSEFAWSRDARTIYFVSDRDPEPYYKEPATAIYAIEAKGGDARVIVEINGAARSLSLSPDGSRVAVIGQLNGDRTLSYQQPDLLVVSLQPGAGTRNLTAQYDFDIGGSLAGDQHPPKAAGRVSPFWSADGRFVFVTATEEGRSNLKRIDAETAKVEAVTTGDHDVYSAALTPSGRSGAVAISTPTRIGDLYALDVSAGKLTQLTDVNAALFGALNLTEPETVWYQSFDGKRIQAWVQRPPDYSPGRKYPFILNIHGGPHAAYGFTFSHEFQWMAAKGYVVLYPNPRGSTSYGQDFGNVIQYKYPGDDYKDLMAGVDELIKRGVADPDALGITGGSGGGVLTNWAVTQTDRFKAAVSQRSIADWASWWYTADIHRFRPNWFRAAPWQDEADFKSRSSLPLVENIHTPIMFVEGEADLRTPPAAGGEALFRALKYLKRPTVMVQFPGESHELSRSGKPRHRVERLQHIVAWFDKYIGKQPITTYDVN